MPTKLPRIFLTLAERDAALVEALAAQLGITKPAVLRRALRQMAKREGVSLS
jgi:hypothetical protein